MNSLGGFNGHCPSCGEIVNWAQMSPITTPVGPCIDGYAELVPRVTGWRMSCGCRLDGWTLYTVMDTDRVSIRLTSPDGIASSEVTCPVTPMTCPPDGTEGSEE